MTPAEKRKRTIKQRYGSYKNMLKKRDVRDLILGGYNGGIQRVRKGFATWEEDKLKDFTTKKSRGKDGRFTKTGEDVHKSTDGLSPQDGV